MSRLSGLKTFLWIIAGFGLVAMAARLGGGLGASSDLTDAMPWGIWKILNMVAGVALATGGFTLAATVYIFDIKKYKPVLKPAITIAFLGYGASCFALFLDIGLPHRIWHPLVYWNHHSFLFEVAWCVMLYFTITVIEVAPMVFEKVHLTWAVRLLKAVTIPIVIVGITLSTLHHTSLGSLFLVMPARLHALWFTQMLPVLFFLSAVGGGMMAVVLVTLAHSFFFERKPDLKMLSGLGQIASVVLAVYLLAKIVDLVYRGAIGELFSVSLESGCFYVEILLSVAVPVVLLWLPRTRQSGFGLTVASLSAVLGLVINRLNVGIVGLLGTSSAGYFPTLAELSLSLGIFAAAGLVFLFMCEYLGVFAATYPAEEKEFDHRAVCDLHSRSWTRTFVTDPVRISLFLTVAIPIAVGLFGLKALHGVSLIPSPVKSPRGVDEKRAVLEINGDRDEDFVHFNHVSHQQRIEADGGSCTMCHHIHLPGDQSSPCHHCHGDMLQGQSIFDHTSHEIHLGGKWSCAECHDMSLPKNASNSKGCVECHMEDMGIKPGDKIFYDYHARSYTDAMHDLCVECHKETAPHAENPRMGECSFCHQEAWRTENLVGENGRIVETVSR